MPSPYPFFTQISWLLYNIPCMRIHKCRTFVPKTHRQHQLKDRTHEKPNLYIALPHGGLYRTSTNSCGIFHAQLSRHARHRDDRKRRRQMAGQRRHAGQGKEARHPPHSAEGHARIHSRNHQPFSSRLCPYSMGHRRI